jgi:hypothetical protein
MTIYTAVYARWTLDALAAKVAELGALLVDTRYTPWSNNPDFRRGALEARFGTSYLWIRDLGNTNYHGGPIQLADPKAALSILAPILAERPVVLLCVCADASQCHRQVAAEFLAERLGGEIVHLEPPVQQGSSEVTISGLTLWRPWPWLICDPERVLGAAQKPIENRPWKPAQKYIGSYIAIHAGKAWDEDAVGGIDEILWNFLGDARPMQWQADAYHPSGVIVGVARLVGVAAYQEDGDGVEIIMGEGDATSVARSPWFFGPCGWLLDRITPIEPVKCSGARGLWPLPDDVLGEVRAGWKAARRARVTVSA